MKVTARKRTRFIQHLREGMAVVHACAQINVSSMHMYRIRRAEPDFMKQWLEAIEEWEATLLQQMEAEADRRAMEGTVRPVGFYKGKPSGAVREYSDSLLMFRMKKLDPSYRETPQIDVSQSVHLNGPPAARMTIEQKTELETLSVDQTRAMLRIVSGDE